MRGIRVDRLLATTAVVLLLSAPALRAESPEGTLGVTAAPAASAVPAEDPVSTPAAMPEAPLSEEMAAPAAAAAVEAPATDASRVEATAMPIAAPDELTGTLPAAPASPAATPAAPASPAATALAEPDAAVAAELRHLAEGKFDAVIGGKQDRATLDVFYSGRDYAPLWLTGGQPNARAKAVIAYLGQVDADGLEPADYPVPNFAAASDPAAQADAEMRLTASVLTYARHASVGRVHWSRVSADISYDTKAPEAADVLAGLARASDMTAALDAYEPHQPAYRALKAKLAELRGGHETVKTPIPSGPVLKVGLKTPTTDDRVPALRERLGIDGDGDVYDKPLADAVKNFQAQHRLAPSGTLTAATVDALNGRMPADHTTDIILANMERWRWMPHDLGRTYVMVNLNDFMLHVMHDGRQVWETKIVDGKPSTPTPIMSAEMRSITVNPTWNVPPSIANSEYLPLLRQDPTILARMGLNVSRNPDGTLHVSQPPGPQNALGQIRFNFPNKFLVYQHDSNQKYLFSTVQRDQSHGCMRVEDPVKYAEVLLSLVRPSDGYTEGRIYGMFHTLREAEIPFPHTLPVHLTYQTAFVDERGKLQLRDDIYGRDRVLISILKGEERRMADSAVEHHDNTMRREALAMPEQAWHGFGGQGLFQRLFGGGYSYAAPQRRPAMQRRTELR